MKPFAPLPQDDERAYSYAIGGVFINFGALEMISFRWVEVLGKDPVVMRDLAIDMNLRQRINFIIKLITRSSWAPEIQARSISLWERVAVESKTRNTLAHNPFVWVKNKEGQPVSGIANAKQMKGDGPYEYKLVTADEIEGAALRARELLRDLSELLYSQTIQNDANTEL
jgi:hypothetical protein